MTFSFFPPNLGTFYPVAVGAPLFRLHGNAEHPSAVPDVKGMSPAFHQVGCSLWVFVDTLIRWRKFPSIPGFLRARFSQHEWCWVVFKTFLASAADYTGVFWSPDAVIHTHRFLSVKTELYSWVNPTWSYILVIILCITWIWFAACSV